MKDEERYDPLKEFQATKQKPHYLSANMLKRFLAFLADLLIINLFLFIPFRALLVKMVALPTDSLSSFMASYTYLMSNPETLDRLSIVVSAMLFMMLLYFVLMERFTNQTLGKKLFGLYIITVDDAVAKQKVMSRIGLFKALVRNMLFIPLFPFSFLFIIDPIYMLFNPSKQRLSEVLSRTVVVEHPLLIKR